MVFDAIAGAAAAIGLVSMASSGSGPQAQKGAEARLKELDLMLPPEIAPAANYVNYVSSGKLLFFSGNTGGPDWAGKGKLGREFTVEQGRQAARRLRPHHADQDPFRARKP